MNNGTCTGCATTGSRSNGATVELGSPTRTGYEFTGWTITAGSGTLSGNSITINASNVTVTAQWVKVQAENLSFDKTVTGFNCTDAQCAIDSFWNMLN